MLQQYSVATQLVSIIQAIQLRRETGMLIAKRGKGASAEEGRIVFTNGRITEVTITPRITSDAFNHISTWENCLVAFISQDPAKTIFHLLENSSPAGNIPAEEPKTVIFPTPLPKGARPVHEQRQNQSHNIPIPPPSLPLPFARLEPVIFPPSLIQPLPFALQTIEHMGLSRAHRQLVLLLDGKRFPEDLVPMMGRTINSIQDLLQDLKDLQLI